MSKSHQDVKLYFEDVKTPRLDISMLPRDEKRVTGTMRKVLCTSFNYTRKYPKKMDKFIEIMRWVTNYALDYKHYLDIAEAEKVEKAKVEAESAVAELTAKATE